MNFDSIIALPDAYAALVAAFPGVAPCFVALELLRLCGLGVGMAAGVWLAGYAAWCEWRG